MLCILRRSPRPGADFVSGWVGVGYENRNRAGQHRLRESQPDQSASATRIATGPVSIGYENRNQASQHRLRESQPDQSASATRIATGRVGVGQAASAVGAEPPHVPLF
jgi:hypothetical protein